MVNPSENTIKTPVFQPAFLHPRYWPVWLLFAFWYLLVLLPYPLLVLLGKLIGRTVLLFAKERRLVTARNLELCFPEKSLEERTRIMRDSFESAGVAIFEIGMAWWWPEWRLKKLVRVEGLEHVKNLQGQGAVLLGMHFVTLDLAGTGLSLFQSYGSMYRPHKNPVFDFVQFRGRSRRNRRDAEALVIFPCDDSRTMVRLLRDGKLVWYAPDQDYGIQYGVFAPWFGIPAATITATAKLVKMGKAKVLPFTHERLPNCQGYRIVIHPPIANFPIGDDVQDATTINQVIEQQVRRLPGQYLWAHRRFKNRPKGEADLYGFKKKSRDLKYYKRRKR